MKASAQQKPHNLVHLHRDRGYRFTDRDRDPVLEEICDLIDKSGLSAHAISELTAKSTGGALKIAEQTIAHWLNGTTRRPQNYTVTWVAHVLGYERRFIKLTGGTACSSTSTRARSVM